MESIIKGAKAAGMPQVYHLMVSHFVGRRDLF